MKLFKFQNECVNDLLVGFKKNRAQCLAWYTGAGKTNVFIELCRRMIDKNPDIKIGISAYLTTEIKDQVAERLKDFGLEPASHTIISGAAIPKNKNVYVFNPQTIYKTPLPFKLDLLIIDESHAGLTEGTVMLRRIIKHNSTKGTRLLLVSATPWDVLSLDEFKDAPVFKRPLDQGLSDGLLTDFRFHAQEAQITFEEKDFSRKGDLGKNATIRKMAILKSACVGKMEWLLKECDKELGKKVLVVCPPGNAAEVARTLQERFGGLCFLQTHASSKHEYWQKTDGNLEKFKDDPSVRFLFVVNKCSVGFDMQDLSSVVDLTMTRNIKVLAQRCGRVARQNGNQKKNYFYVYDKSLMKNQLEWLVATMIDFSLGAYDGWTTKITKYRSIKLGGWSFIHPYSTTIKEVVAALRDKSNIKNQRTLAYITATPPTRWTLDLAKEKMGEYDSRTDMWKRNPALYKWFRLNAKAEMDAHFPFKNTLGKWNEKTVIAAMKTCESRIEFKKRFSGAEYWITSKKRQDLIEKHLPPSRSSRRWTHESVTEKLKEIRTWAHIRGSYRGLRRWMHKNGGEQHWKDVWDSVRDEPRERGRPSRMTREQKNDLRATKARYKEIYDRIKKEKAS